jgi:predicted amidohydrolase YtcJ
VSPTLLVAAGVRTLVAGDPAVRAVLIEGDRITWVGADPAAAPPHGRAVDLGGAVIAPAFVDAHVHATATGLAAEGVDLAGTRSAAELLDRLRRHVAARGDAVVLGGPWDDFGWPEGAPPTAAALAEAAPGRTLLLMRVDAHACLVDPATLAALPLDRLEGIDRDADGAPTGLLREAASEAAQVHVRASLAPAQVARARTRACATAAALGIGSLHEMGHPSLSGLDDARAWATGRWPIEVLVWWAELDADAGPAHGLRPGGDLFLDGSIGSHTAAVCTPYRDRGGRGELFHDDAAVAAFFTAATAAGRGAGVHAIGGRAIAQAVAAIEAAAEALGVEAVRACRHRIEHVELPTRDDVARMARLGVVASVQPAFDAAWGGDAGMYAARFGGAAARSSNPLAWFADAGVPLAFGSDSTVTPLDPWGGVVAAERHRGGLGVDRAAALAAATLGGRHVAGQDDVGPLVAGGRADLAVWSADPLAVDDPRDLDCLATVVAGRVAHGDLDLDGGGTPARSRTAQGARMTASRPGPVPAVTTAAVERAVAVLLGASEEDAAGAVAVLEGAGRLGDGIALVALVLAARRGTDAAGAVAELAEGRPLPDGWSDYEVRAAVEEVREDVAAALGGGRTGEGIADVAGPDAATAAVIAVVRDGAGALRLAGGAGPSDGAGEGEAAAVIAHRWIDALLAAAGRPALDAAAGASGSAPSDTGSDGVVPRAPAYVDVLPGGAGSGR